MMGEDRHREDPAWPVVAGVFLFLLALAALIWGLLDLFGG